MVSEEEESVMAVSIRHGDWTLTSGTTGIKGG